MEKKMSTKLQKAFSSLPVSRFCRHCGKYLKLTVDDFADHKDECSAEVAKRRRDAKKQASKKHNAKLTHVKKAPKK